MCDASAGQGRDPFFSVFSGVQRPRQTDWAQRLPARRLKVRAVKLYMKADKNILKILLDLFAASHIAYFIKCTWTVQFSAVHLVCGVLNFGTASVVPYRIVLFCFFTTTSSSPGQHLVTHKPKERHHFNARVIKVHCIHPTKYTIWDTHHVFSWCKYLISTYLKGYKQLLSVLLLLFFFFNNKSSRALKEAVQWASHSSNVLQCLIMLLFRSHRTYFDNIVAIDSLLEHIMVSAIPAGLLIFHLYLKLYILLLDLCV